MVSNLISKIDYKFLSFIKWISSPLVKLSLFIVFFWFGLLKVINLISVNELIVDSVNLLFPVLVNLDLSLWFGIYEMIVGLLFVTPRYDKFNVWFLTPYLVVFSLPLFLLTDVIWQQALVPSLEGQLVIKNIAIIILALGFVSHLRRFNR